MRSEGRRGQIVFTLFQRVRLIIFFSFFAAANFLLSSANTLGFCVTFHASLDTLSFSRTKSALNVNTSQDSSGVEPFIVNIPLIPQLLSLRKDL